MTDARDIDRRLTAWRAVEGTNDDYAEFAPRIIAQLEAQLEAIAAGSGTAKTPQAVECEASQSGHRPPPTPSPKEE